MTNMDLVSHQSDAMRYFLYADDRVKWSDRPFSYRLKWYLTRYLNRISDAWLVLTGRAQIGED